MDNSFLVYSDDKQVDIERFHVCIWEISGVKPFVEFGLEVEETNFNADDTSVELNIFIPWLKMDEFEISDLYPSLKQSQNSRFIFNDSISNTRGFDGGDNYTGVIHTFSGNNSLCVMPIETELNNQSVKIKIDLKEFHLHCKKKEKIYVRFLIKPTSKSKTKSISLQKKGIGKTTIIYDIKINEKRNIPESRIETFKGKKFANIKTAYCFNILPNEYDVVLFDQKNLKSVRTLEHDSFQKYLPDYSIPQEELMVVFNKKVTSDSYNFFSVYAKETLGVKQFSFALLLNIFCGFLFFMAAYRHEPIPDKGFFESLLLLPSEAYIALVILIITMIYFIVTSKYNIKLRKK